MVTRLDNLQYHLISSVKDWDVEYEEIRKNIIGQRCEILSLTHTPRNIGQVNIQILWFLPANPASPQSYTYKHITSQTQQDAIEQARLYLDEWVPPHRLVSVSAFEEDHPNHSSFNIVILVRGDIEKPIQPPVGSRNDSCIGKIYSLDLSQTNGGWISLLSQGLTNAEARDRATFSSLNISQNKQGGEVDHQGLLAISWSKTHEDILFDSERGFCQCYIF